MSELSAIERVHLGLPAVAGSVEFMIRSGFGHSGETVTLHPEEASCIATKLLVLAALASKEPLPMVERVMERVRWLVDSLTGAEAMLVPPAHGPALPITPPPYSAPLAGPSAPPVGRLPARRNQPVRCDICEQICGSPAGLGRHRSTKHRGAPPATARPAPVDPGVLDEIDRDLDPEALAAEFGAQPERVGKHRFTGDHRLDREGTSIGGYRAYCTCGWVTEPQPGTQPEARAAARDRLHEHIEEMEAARHGLLIAGRAS